MSAPVRLRSFGAGPDVLLLHGCPTPSDDLRPMAEALAATYRAWLADLPGYGPSPPLEGEYTFPRAQAVVEDALLERGVRRLAVVGHSAGAYRALLMAAESRLEVAAVVSLSGFVNLAPEERAGFRQLAAALRAGADLRDLFPPRMLSPTWAAAHPEHVAAVKRWIDAAPVAVVAVELDAAAASPDLRPLLARCPLPVLARVGELDVASPPRHSEEVARAVPKGRIEVVPGVGHALMLEDLDGTVAAIHRALA